jgi:hypothetical protein
MSTSEVVIENDLNETLDISQETLDLLHRISNSLAPKVTNTGALEVVGCNGCAGGCYGGCNGPA